MDAANNEDPAVVRGFGDEWSRFDQQALSDAERNEVFNGYFSLFPWDELPPGSIGADIGCGSGRWAVLAAPRVGRLHCVDPSAEALAVAERSLRGQRCAFHLANANSLPFDDASLDFAYSLGVLHHAPDTASALGACVRKLKPGAPFLLYLYYAFDNRPPWFRALWRVSDAARRLLSRAPYPVMAAATGVIAAALYWPLARAAGLAERAGANVDQWPLSFYRRRSFYVMLTDARDRFGTRLEQRFTRAQIEEMMTRAGLQRISFRDGEPYWVALGYRAAERAVATSS